MGPSQRHLNAARPQADRRSIPAEETALARESGADFPVVGIGASAGGLDACRHLLDALPAGNGMAFILVQHLDPNHESMMVDLLAGQTSMTVRQAADGMPVERDHLYIIPPGAYLSVGSGILHLTQPQARHGARLPFDFLLKSLANEYREHAICVILSGTGADGSLGLKAVKAKGGYIIAQSPGEAAYDGMPHSAIATGLVDRVLTVAEIPEALVQRDRRRSPRRAEAGAPQEAEARNCVPEIVELLRTRTTHDFTLYKPGTLQRRIAQRMTMVAIEADGAGRYLEILRNDANELDLLAKDLLINVTSFFRDPKVFEFLADKAIPRLVRDHPAGQPLRIWVAGCSTGEEAYSIAMLFQEEIATAKSGIKLQVFASDVDPDAVEIAREGLYPDTLEADVSEPRLARFFQKEAHGYRVSAGLRASIVFTVQDVLADPPFSRLDMVSCRNLMIYLGSEAQARVVSVFHFALREDGMLLLGGAEAMANIVDRFEIVSKADRLYRRIGRNRSGEFGFSRRAVAGSSAASCPGQYLAPSRQAALTGLCKRLVMDSYMPAAVLINRKCECQYFMGPTDRYLQLAPGRPVQELLAMAREGVRIKLRSAIQRAWQENKRIVVPSGHVNRDGTTIAFSIAAEPVQSDGEELLLVCFIDEPLRGTIRALPIAAADVPRVVELERELEDTKAELMGAIHNLELSSEEQRTVNEEALSVNEEYQSTNEELLTSKEELQSLNEELIALNSQLQETLERQRTTSNDLQNVLYSTDVATIFLDTTLSIRFFTPATKSLFSIIPGDIGRPLADLKSPAADGALVSDARRVLEGLAPIEREIETESGGWFIRRISPYRTQERGVEGVVITFADITERKRATDALETAKRQAQMANMAKSRFLATASHDLRQPLQTLALLQEQLTKAVEGDKEKKLVARLEKTLGTMASMLNTLLDINQIEAGTIRTENAAFPVSELFERLQDEFAYHAQARNLELRVVSSHLSIQSDSRLLEQIIRNLLSNALKYTRRGKVLLGCRRRNGSLRIEVWDTGAGIPEEELGAIFEEYHQLGNAAPERSLGLGLGLSIVRRLGSLLGHEIAVRSSLGRGSVFSVEVPLQGGASQMQREHVLFGEAVHEDTVRRRGAVLVVEDDLQTRELLEALLQAEGHYVATAPNGIVAVDLVARGTVRPDVILTDYNLPDGMDGLEVSAKLRELLQRHIPVIVLTGDISTDVLRRIAGRDCIQLNKPVKLTDLSQTIQRLLPISQAAGNQRLARDAETATQTESCVVFVVDDDSHILESMRTMLEGAVRTVETYSTGEAFLHAGRPTQGAVLLIDACLPGMSGMDLLRRLTSEGRCPPTIMITGKCDVHSAVEAMKAGASDFMEKPIRRDELLESIDHALQEASDATRLSAWRETAATQIAALTSRQREIMDLVLAGHPSKNIAADLGISQRTVESHRASIMRRTGLKSLPALARLALAAAGVGPGETADQCGFPDTAAWPVARR